ncbi:NrfD/PsrC family molybdoenzyme membrane anchor subunit [Desulfotomaculum copahuensis]|uniref:Hydrogenase n=1 Tax=Desulfotomaculum copahuensis TaxID=1838280 RepID=A0A1B7LC25_9FIRM|nr:Ni/Fe-hydrogenase cytochrome b subunit [Desulfotomaculum copahuensis]OAT80229.1 hydrogenase [Desulfotomaculum copahuensis]
METKQGAARWRFPLTPTRCVLIALALLGLALSAYRLAAGLGAVTNLNDHWPWGLWIGFDVLTGVALAGGGYSTCLLVYVLNVAKFKSIARSALLTSLIGYLLVLFGLFMDIGRWFNFWRPFVSWGYHSVLFEVFWCISLYTLIQLLEFGHIATEKVGTAKLHRFFEKILPVLFIIGIVLPTLHQSSLGSLYLIEVGKLYPLWWSPFLPLFFLTSSFFVGPAMVMLETSLSGKVHHSTPEPQVYNGLIKVTGFMMVFYLLLKIYDLVSRGVLNLAFQNTLEGHMFLLEMLGGIIIPLLIFAVPAWRTSRTGQVVFSVLVTAGLILNRMNVVFTGMSRSLGGHYFPSFIEWAVSIGIVALGVLVYLFVVENFNILPQGRDVQQEKEGSTRAAA